MTIAPGTRVFAGQRAEGFYVDLGAIFDLGILRPFEQDHTTFGLANTGLGKMANGVNSTAGVNVHSIAIEVPINDLTVQRLGTDHRDRPPCRARRLDDGQPTEGPAPRRSAVGELQRSPISTSDRPIQVSRLGNPLVNEVVIPLAAKDYWNTQPPSADAQFASRYAHPELAGLLPVLYPGVFPKLAAYNATGAARADLLAILLTGIPAGVVPGFQNFTGATQADMLRLNVAIPPTAKGPSNLGLIGGDPAGFPNGRRVFDDVATIEIRAIAGATLPLVDPAFKADAAAGAVSMGLTSGPGDLTAMGTENYLTQFPWLGIPHSGSAAHTKAV